MRRKLEYVEKIRSTNTEDLVDVLSELGQQQVNAVVKLHRVPCDFLAEILDKTDGRLRTVAGPTAPSSNSGYERHRAAIVQILSASPVPLGASALAAHLEYSFPNLWLATVSQEGGEAPATARIRAILRRMRHRNTIEKLPNGCYQLFAQESM